MQCKICNSSMQEVFRHSVLRKHDVAYFKCWSCDYLCTEKPYWLDEAYKNTITRADTGLLSRNIDLSRQIAMLIYYLFKSNGRYLDYAGGYGVFSRLMRDAGFEFYHDDPYTTNLFAQDLTWDQSTQMDGVTCLECFEHFVDPMADIRKITSISQTIIFSTTLLTAAVPALTWDYYGFDHGQHISFYSKKTVSCIAEQLNAFVMSVGNLHLFTSHPLSAKKVTKLVRAANRVKRPFSSRTNFELLVRKMQMRKQSIKE